MTTWLPLNSLAEHFANCRLGLVLDAKERRRNSVAHSVSGCAPQKTTRLTSVRTVVIALVAQLAEQGDETPIAQVRVLSSASIPG